MKVEVGWRSAELSALPSKLFFSAASIRKIVAPPLEKLLNALDLAEDFSFLRLCIFLT
jgi:hypothetical protein